MDNLFLGLLLVLVFFGLWGLFKKYRMDEEEGFRGRRGRGWGRRGWGRRGWGRRGWVPWRTYGYYPTYYNDYPWWWSIWPWGYYSTYGNYNYY